MLGYPEDLISGRNDLRIQLEPHGRNRVGYTRDRDLPAR